MSKQANKTLIGAFVVGAVVLLVATVMIFGSGKFFRKTYKAVMYFEGSIKGLNVGAPVMFRGVKIGTVTNINLILNAKDLSLQTPVVAEFDPKSWTLIEGERGDLSRIKLLIDRGLRAQLQMQSFVTGQLMIALDFFPNKPARFVGRMTKYPEIPTVPTSLEELSKTLQDLPLRDIIMKLDLLITGVHDIVKSPHTKETVQNLNLTLQETHKLVTRLNDQIDPLMTSLTTTASTARDSLDTAKKTMADLSGESKALIASAKVTLDTANSALRQAEKTLGTVSDDSRLVFELNRTLRELSAAARSMRILTDYLERHPEAVLKGKPKQEGVSK